MQGKEEKKKWLLTKQLLVPHSYHDAGLYFYSNLILPPQTERKDYAELLSCISQIIAITVAKQGKAALQKKQGIAAATMNTTKEVVFLAVNVFTLFFAITPNPLK